MTFEQALTNVRAGGTVKLEANVLGRTYYCIIKLNNTKQDFLVDTNYGGGIIDRDNRVCGFMILSNDWKTVEY